MFATEISVLYDVYREGCSFLHVGPQPQSLNQLPERVSMIAVGLLRDRGHIRGGVLGQKPTDS
jgi:hypothetical protein